MCRCLYILLYTVAGTCFPLRGHPGNSYSGTYYLIYLMWPNVAWRVAAILSYLFLYVAGRVFPPFYIMWPNVAWRVAAIFIVSIFSCGRTCLSSTKSAPLTKFYLLVVAYRMPPKRPEESHSCQEALVPRNHWSAPYGRQEQVNATAVPCGTWREQVAATMLPISLPVSKWKTRCSLGATTASGLDNYSVSIDQSSCK